MDYEEAYFKDILPELGGYMLEREGTGFESSEIAEGLARYSQEEVEEVLDYIAEAEEVTHLERGTEGWQFKAFEAETWEQVDEELEENKEGEDAEEKLPDVREAISQLNPQGYGKLRNNLDEVYEGLREVKDEKSSYFKARDIKEKVSNVRAPEIGLVLSGLAAAGLVKKYRDRNDYEPDSIDTERIEEFKEAIENIESFEDFKELVKEEN
ncbi:MAG: hypothetical protein ABEK04_06075 [Candidatus Nanohalobium sp.]